MKHILETCVLATSLAGCAGLSSRNQSEDFENDVPLSRQDCHHRIDDEGDCRQGEKCTAGLDGVTQAMRRACLQAAFDSFQAFVDDCRQHRAGMVIAMPRSRYGPKPDLWTCKPSRVQQLPSERSEE